MRDDLWWRRHGDRRVAAAFCHGAGVPARGRGGSWGEKFHWKEVKLVSCSIWVGVGWRACSRGELKLAGDNGGQSSWACVKGGGSTPFIGQEGIG